MQTVYQQPSCLAHSFCSDGSSIVFFAPCLQTDSGSGNTQWPSVLCQYCWSQSCHLSTGRIYWCFLSLHCMAKPWLWYWNMFLWWNGRLQQNMAAICVSYVYLVASRTYDSCEQLLTQICKAAWQQPSVCVGNTHPPLIHKDPSHIDCCILHHLPWISNIQQRSVAVQCKYWLPQWETHSTLPGSSGCLSFPLSSLHSLASFWSMATGRITPEALLMGQQCQAETFLRFIPCSLQSKTSLLARTTACASLCSASGCCFEPPARSQC